MDELLEIVEVIADFGLEGVLTWILRLIGLVVLLVGLGLWLFTEMGLIVPGVLVVGGLVLLTVPGILLSIVEFAG